jgi:hypothetical protein
MNKYDKYDKSMAELKAILNKDVRKDEQIIKLIEWVKGEYVKIPEKYPGDHYVVDIIRRNVALGLSLNVSLEKTFAHFKIIFETYSFNRARS